MPRLQRLLYLSLPPDPSGAGPLGPKCVSNDQNCSKWPQNGPCGPFRARQGDILGHFGPCWSSGTNKTHNCALWKPPVFVLCWLDFRQFGCFGCFWGPVEHFWRPFAAFGALFGSFGDHFGPILPKMGQKKDQNGSKWLKMTINGPKSRLQQ